MAKKRWIEPFSRTRIGFGSEATTFTGSACTDLDNPTAKTNFYITDRTKQYFSKDDAVTWLLAAVAIDPVASPYTQQKLGGIFRSVAALTGSPPIVTVSGKSIPMYILKGGRSMNDTKQRSEIDTTSNGDGDMTGDANRPKVGGGFTFIPGATFTNAAAKVVTFKNMMEATADTGSYLVLEIVNDTTDALLPRDVYYANLGNTDMQRNLGQAIESPITWFLAVCDDSIRSRAFIDYVA